MHQTTWTLFARTTVPRDANPVEKGYAFEQFIISMFEHQNYFTLLEWRSEKKIGKIAPISNRNPDLEFEFEFKSIRNFCNLMQVPACLTGGKICLG